MSSQSELGTILVVEGDAVLSRVLGQVLAREGLTIAHAVNAAQALQLAERHSPRLALVDDGRCEGSALELAEELHRWSGDLPVIIMTDCPLRGQEHLTGAGRFVHFLSRPFNLQDLRQVVDVALGDGEAHTAALAEEVGLAVVPYSNQLHSFLAIAKEIPMRDALVKFSKAAAFIVLILLVLAGVAMATGAVRVPWQAAAAVKPTAPPPKSAGPAVELVDGQPHTLAVPDDVLIALGIRKGTKDMIAVAKKPTQMRPLVMPGSTALDPTRLFRIRARFAPSPSSAEVVQIAQVREDPAHTGKVETVFREIRSGDRVKKGDLLAVFHSVDVGNKKNDLIDALYQLKLDEEILKRAEEKKESVPEVFLLNARRNVQGDKNAINRAVSTLKTWGIPEEDIQAVRDEAKNVIERQGEHNKEKDALWPRVEIRAPDDGVIIERNVSLHEIVVDNTTNLFQIANVDKLTVFANVPEDDLPTLEVLTSNQRRWTVRTVGSDPIPGFIDDIGYLIDPNQHTAVVKGHIANKEGKLRGGQFISGTVELPPPPDVVEVPIDAVVEDGQQCVVFVQTDPEKHHYTMRRIQLTHRFEKTSFVRSKPFAKGEERTPEEEELGILPKEPLRPGERILQSGVGELKAALLDKESAPNKERKEGKDK